MPGVHVPNEGKTVLFKPEKEEGYVYELPDGAAVRIRCNLQRLSRSQFGTLMVQAQTAVTLEAPSPRIITSAETFTYPEKILHQGCYVYTTDQKESVRVRPSLKMIERTVDARGTVDYKATVIWVADLNGDDVMKAMT